MKIVHYFDHVQLERGGTIRAALDMCRVFAARGHDVTLVTFDDTDVPAEWRDGTPAPAGTWPKVVKIAPPSLPAEFYPPGGPAGLRPVLEGADVIHLHGVWLPSTAQACAMAHKHGVATVISCHGMLDEWSMQQSVPKKKAYLALAGRKMFGRIDVFHATAEDEKRQASAWVPAVRTEVVPYITDLRPFESLPGPGQAIEHFKLDDGVPNILFLSRLHYKKQPDTLIRAAALLAERGVPGRVLFAGTGDDAYVAKLRALAAEHKLGEDRCRFLGMVTGDLKHSLYQAVDLFALPTSQENFGLVYTESLACGTPIIATKGTDIWRELEASGAATIADANAEAFADAIAELLSDRASLPARGEAGRRYVFDWLEVDRTASGFEKLYRQAITNRAARA